MNRLTEEQRRRNFDARADFSTTQTHREHVTLLLLEGVQPGRETACILGAGNCNDLDLPTLVEQFAAVHLVDVDPEALQNALKRQHVAENASVQLHGGIDVTGVWDRLAAWKPETSPSNEDIDNCLAESAAFADRATSLLQGAELFDRVASLCLLSQLIEGAVLTLGERHPRFLELVRTIRGSHLKLMLNLLRPGGKGLLVTDFVSSETAPELLSISDDNLPETVQRLVDSGNFFHGLNPAVLVDLLKTDPQIAPEINDIQVIPPWRWNVGRRLYAVFAIRFRKNSESGSGASILNFRIEPNALASGESTVTRG